MCLGFTVLVGSITLSFVVICETLVLIGCCLFWFDLKLFY